MESARNDTLLFIINRISVRNIFWPSADPSLEHLTYLGYYFVILSTIGLYNLYQNFKNKNIRRTLFWNISGWIVMTLLFFYSLYPQVDAENPVQKLLPQIDSEQKIISYSRLNPAFVFALEREIPRYPSIEEIQEIVETYRSGYVISRTNYLDELSQIPGLEYHAEAKDLFETPTTLVMKWSR